MQPHILAVRAIGSLYVLEVIKPILRIIAVILALLAVGTLALTIKVSAWWLFAFLPLAPVILIFIVISQLVLTIAKAVAPTMNPSQTEAARNYIANMHDVSDRIKTPQFIIAFKIILDVYKRRWKDGYIQQTTNNTAKLKRDFAALVASFGTVR